MNNKWLTATGGKSAAERIREQSAGKHQVFTTTEHRSSKQERQFETADAPIINGVRARSMSRSMANESRTVTTQGDNVTYGDWVFGNDTDRKHRHPGQKKWHTPTNAVGMVSGKETTPTQRALLDTATTTVSATTIVDNYTAFSDI